MYEKTGASLMFLLVGRGADVYDRMISERERSKDWSGTLYIVDDNGEPHYWIREKLYAN